MKISIRKTKLAEINELLEIYEIARGYMRASGNPHQWDDGYPTREILIDDIEAGNSYVGVDEAGEIHFTFYLHFGQDPTYEYIDGAWLNDDAYGTIHRIASNGKAKGIVKLASDFGLSQCDNLRIDTAHENTTMRHVLEKLDFKACGTIYLANGDPRLAFHKIRTE